MAIDRSIFETIAPLLPVSVHEAVVRFARNAGGFSLHNCPQGKEVAAAIGLALNSRNVAAVRAAVVPLGEAEAARLREIVERMEIDKAAAAIVDDVHRASYAAQEENARLRDVLTGLKSGDVLLMRMAVEAGDPKAELLVRCDMMDSSIRAALGAGQ